MSVSQQAGGDINGKTHGDEGWVAHYGLFEERKLKGKRNGARLLYVSSHYIRR